MLDELPTPAPSTPLERAADALARARVEIQHAWSALGEAVKGDRPIGVTFWAKSLQEADADLEVVLLSIELENSRKRPSAPRTDAGAYTDIPPALKIACTPIGTRNSGYVVGEMEEEIR